MVSNEKKRVFITLDYGTLALLDDFSWSEKMTKSEFVKKLILDFEKGQLADERTDEK